MCQWDDKISGDNLSSVYNSVICKYNHKKFYSHAKQLCYNNMMFFF